MFKKASFLICLLVLTASSYAEERPPPTEPMNVDSFALLNSHLSPIFHNEKDEQCTITAVDLVFVVDESGSIEYSNFQIVLQFLVNITMSLDIGTGDLQSQVGMVEFSDEGHKLFALNAHETLYGVQQAIIRASYIGGGTNISDGMMVAVQEVFIPSAGNRPNARNVMIVLTDGQDPSNDLKSARQAALAKNISIFAIGIGNDIDEKQLLTITQDPEHVYLVQNFTGLPSILPTVCSGLNSTVPSSSPSVSTTIRPRNQPRPCGNTVSKIWLDIVFVLDSSNTVQTADFNANQC